MKELLIKQSLVNIDHMPQILLILACCIMHYALRPASDKRKLHQLPYINFLTGNTVALKDQ